MNAASTFRDAVLEDGRYVLHEVFAKLYVGGDCRPDIFLKRKKGNGRFSIFNPDQLQAIEDSGLPDYYDPYADSSDYDISLLSVLIERACGLSENDLLLKNVKEVKQLRNDVCHNMIHIDRENLGENLDEFLSLLTDIIEELQKRTPFGSLQYVKLQVSERIQTRIQKARVFPLLNFVNTSVVPSSSHGNRVSLGSEAMPTWQKVALGVTAGIGAVAMGAAAYKEDQKRKENKDRRQEDECIVM